MTELARHFTARDVPGPKREFPGYGRHKPSVVWPDNARVAVSLIVNNEEGSEYSQATDGRNEGLAEIPYVMDPQYRDLCAESVYEYGSRAGIWRILSMFDEYKVKTTFFGAAVCFELNPEVAQWVVESGHEPCSHGWRWSEHWLMSRDEERQKMQWAIESFERTVGRRPVGWYCRYGPSVNTRELLVEEGGFLYDSDAYNDDLPYFTEVQGKQHLVIPYTLVYNDGRFVLPQGFSSPSDFAETVKRGFDELGREADRGFPKMLSIGLHPRWIGQAARSSGLREVIEHVLGNGGIFMTREEIAHWWIDHHEEWRG